MTPSVHSTDDPIEVAFDHIRDLISRRYFGVVQLSFQSGQLTHFREDRSLKPADLVAISKKGNYASRDSH